ncbi:polysaccharide biosynthesis/export protein [Bacteroidales bacterium KA00251]|nr:polysaccharide biosynthesis/export protein [Bacteroidales bacterium KA00251]
MKRLLVLLFIPIVALFAGCGTTKDLAYLQTMEKQVTLERSRLQDTKIVAKDILTVKVDASNPELVAAFNGIYWNPQQQYTSSSTGVNTYLVDREGRIQLPYLGLVKVGGCTLREAEQVVRDRLEVYLNEKPTVNILIQNFRYSVLGEVQHPGAFIAPNGKVSILEALANAGDMTIYGIRDDVKLFRENTDGSSMIISLNLKDISLLNSPYFYLQQGDVLYVLPNDAKASSSTLSTSASLWLSASSIGIALVNLMFTIFRK